MLKIHPEVLNALQNNLPVVALESTIISHGLPRPRNHQAALDFEQILRDKGVVPATIAVIDGIPNIGLDEAALDVIANQDIAKASVRDLPILAAKGISGATTVAATAIATTAVIALVTDDGRLCRCRRCWQVLLVRRGPVGRAGPTFRFGPV